jgi:hypothetical protein
MPETLAEAPPAAGPAPRRPRDRATFLLVAFGAVLLVGLLGGYGIGSLGTGVPAAARSAAMPGMTMPHDDTGAAPHVHNADGSVTMLTGAAAGPDVGGQSLSSAGLTLVPLGTLFPAGRAQPFRFRVTAAGAPVTAYAVVHGKPLHLVVVRRDLSGYRHLHPVMAPDGTWSVPLTLPGPGVYRAIADFTAVLGGRQVAATLGVDLTVAGDYTPVAPPAATARATAGGFTATYAGVPRAGVAEPLLVRVAGPDGRPAALEPYLGAYGHLVVLRLGDVGYVHVHPEPQLADGAVRFWLAAPGPGTYRMFFDFQVAGAVHTAAWTATVS